MDEQLTSVLPIVADSWARLRWYDVHRLIGAVDHDSAESLQDAARVVAARRPDLASVARESALDLAEEYNF